MKSIFLLTVGIILFEYIPNWQIGVQPRPVTLRYRVQLNGGIRGRLRTRAEARRARGRFKLSRKEKLALALLAAKEKSLEEGPNRTMYYDPTYGYEPYWKDGDWVHGNEETNTTIGPNCPYQPDDCPGPLEQFGMICARNTAHQNKTFKNYCEMLLADCIGAHDWLIMYRGPCTRLLMINWSSHFMATYAAQTIIKWWNNSPSTKFFTPSTTTEPSQFDIDQFIQANGKK